MPTVWAPEKRSETSTIKDLEMRFKGRRRAIWKPLLVLTVSLLLGLILVPSIVFGKPGAVRDLLVSVEIVCGFLVGISAWFDWRIRGEERQDLEELLASNSVETIPALAEYYRNLDGNAPAREKAHMLRKHIVALLRSQSETPHLDFSRFSLYSLIQVITEPQEPSDRFLLLDVVAQSGTPACFGHLDDMVRKVCAWELRKDERAKQELHRRVLECKATIRSNSKGAAEAHSLLRASEPSHGLLHPSSPPRPPAATDNLLRASVQSDPQNPDKT